MKQLIVTILTLILISAGNIQPVSAQAGTPSDLITSVNNLRQSLGLAPYTVDGFLMEFAQNHSNTMASLGTWTHTRPDGSTAFDYGIKENVAMGADMSIQYCIYTAWSDRVHWDTLTAYAAGKVGAGVTVADGNVYYTLNVLPEGSIFNPVAGDKPDVAAIPAQEEQNAPVFISQWVTSTPNEDGIVIHTVQYGETLYTISENYGVPIDIILTNSGLSPTTTEIREGWELIIQTAIESTATPTNSPTPDPGTPTPTQPRPTLTPFPTRTPAPTFTATPTPSIIHRTLGEGRYLGMGLILVSGLGLILVIYLGFLKKP